MSDELGYHPTIKVFIIDDNIVARSMLARLVKDEDDIEIVGEAGTGQGGIIMLGDVSADVILLEASVSGGMHLADIITEIHNISADTQIILCTDFFSAEIIPEATKYGQLDFIHKPYKKSMVLRAIRGAVRGVK